MTRHHGKEKNPFRDTSIGDDDSTPSHAPEWTLTEFGGGLLGSPADLLFAHLPFMASGLRDEDTVRGSERAKQGKAIATHARKLCASLAKSKLETRWPAPLSTAFSKHTYKDVPRDKYGMLDRASWKFWLFYDPTAALNALQEALIPLASAAEDWASTPPRVTKPDAPNAARLRFIREITALFRQMYGTPLREPVAALTSAVFSDPIDVSTVAKLAP